MKIIYKMIAIEPAQAILGTYPQEAPVVLQHTLGHVVYQSILGSNTLELQHGMLGHDLVSNKAKKNDMDKKVLHGNTFLVLYYGIIVTKNYIPGIRPCHRQRST
jgi:hypothetical protein